MSDTTTEKPKATQLAEKLEEGWGQVRPSDGIAVYIRPDGTLRTPQEAAREADSFNGHAYALAKDCVNSVRRAKAKDDSTPESLLAKEFQHIALELNAAATGITGGRDHFDAGVRRA